VLNPNSLPLGYYWIKRSTSDMWIISELRQDTLYPYYRYFSGVNIGGEYDKVIEARYIESPSGA
jgi:hypothetical protein